MSQSLPSSLRYPGLEAVKWAALGLMVLDHANLLLRPVPDALLFMLGRMAFPLFAFVLAMRLAQRPESWRGTLRWLLVWAVASQPIFWLAFSAIHPPELLNIFFTLALGVLLVRLLNLLDTAQRLLDKVMLLTTALALVMAGATVDFGPVAVLALAVLARVGAKSPLAAAVLCGVVGVIINIIPVWNLTAFYVLAMGALGAIPIAIWGLASQRALPRLPRWFFYAAYPAHLLILVALHNLLK